MLTITDNAGIIVSDLVSRAVTTDTGGIRIVAAEDQFAVSVAESPDGNDIVASNGTARVPRPRPRLGRPGGGRPPPARPPLP